MKELALQWLVDSVNARETKATVPKLAPALLPAIAKCAEDAVPGIREGGFTLMVSFAVKVRSELGTTEPQLVLTYLDALLGSFCSQHAASQAPDECGG